MLTISNPKTRKGEAAGYLTGILHLAPANVAQSGNVCPHASPGCLRACLNTAGRGAMQRTQDARIRRTRLLFSDRPTFMRELDKSIGALVRKAKREGLKPAVRLNGTSDLPWETFRAPDGRNVFERWPAVQFYDYTKRIIRALVASPRSTIPWPANYTLTFSRSETNNAECFEVLRAGGSVAVVGSHAAAEAWWVAESGITAADLIVDGDADDLRFLDRPGSIVLLSPKGPAKSDETGFVLTEVNHD